MTVPADLRNARTKGRSRLARGCANSPEGPRSRRAREPHDRRWRVLSDCPALPRCAGRAVHTSRMYTRPAGARQRLTEGALLIVALGVANDRMTGASLWARGADQGLEHSLSSKCGQDHAVRRTAPCVFPAGEALPQETQLQVRAEWNTSRAVLGADVGFVLWVA